MIIYHDEKENTLVRESEGVFFKRYKMYVNGWYAGGFSADSDTTAVHIFKCILAADKEARGV